MALISLRETLKSSLWPEGPDLFPFSAITFHILLLDHWVPATWASLFCKYQACSCLRAFALTVPSAWSAITLYIHTAQILPL